MSTPLSPTVKAGNLLRLLGWITLGYVILTDSAVALIFFAQSMPIDNYILALFAVTLLLCYAILEIGAAVKRNERWAKIVGFGVSFISMVWVPVGTLIGVNAIVYLAKGWRDPA